MDEDGSCRFSAFRNSVKFKISVRHRNFGGYVVQKIGRSPHQKAYQVRMVYDSESCPRHIEKVGKPGGFCHLPL